MINIPSKKKPKKRYEGLKPKLIHLRKDVFEILDTAAKMKNSNLKEYLEYLCTAQAKNEAEKFIEKINQKNKK